MKKFLKILLGATSLLFTILPLAYSETSQNDSTETAGQYLNSSTITTKVKSALLAKKDIDSTKINVQSEAASNGKTIVILTGTQKSQALVELAGLTAKQVNGVTKVINNLTVAK